MSFDRETTRMVRAWLDEGVTQLPDRVLDTVLDQVPVTRQRRPIWWPARTFSTMSMSLKLGLIAVIVTVAALIGTNYFGTANLGGPGIGDPAPTPEQSAVRPAPTPSLTPAGRLPVGPHVLSDGQSPAVGEPSVRITVTIPAPDWYGEPGGGLLQKDSDDTSPPNGAGLIVFGGDLYVYGDPCRWQTTRPDTPSTTVDELVAALGVQVSRDASEPVDVTLDGYAGKAMTLHVPENARFSECDEATFGTWGVPGSDPSPYRFQQGRGQIDEVWIMDVEGELVVIDWTYWPETPAEDVEEMRAIVESVTFESP